MVCKSPCVRTGYVMLGYVCIWSEALGHSRGNMPPAPLDLDQRSLASEFVEAHAKAQYF